MKRDHEEESGDEEEIMKKSRQEETVILQDLQDKLLKGEGKNLNSKINLRVKNTTQQFFTIYMEKLMHKIPMGEELVKIIKDGSNEFEFMFTAAKSVIQSQMHVKQIKAFHAVFDMVYSLMWRYIHEKVVSPSLTKILSSEQLKLAYEKYQMCSQTEDDSSVIEMQCLLYCIQEMLDKEESVKIPNPVYARFTQQVKAMSEYVVTLLISLAKPMTEEIGTFHKHDKTDIDLNTAVNTNRGWNNEGTDSETVKQR